MPKMLAMPVQYTKIAPKDFKCSGCGGTVKHGRVYVKTNWGRYCDGCANELGELKPVTA